MRLTWPLLRKLFIFLCFAWVLITTIHISRTQIPKVPAFRAYAPEIFWLPIASSSLMALESLAVLLYALSLRPRHCRWIWRVLPIAIVLSYTADWLVSGGLADQHYARGVGTYIELLLVYGLIFLSLYFEMRLGYSPELPPKRLSVRIATISFLATAFIAFQKNVPVFEPRIRIEHNYLSEYNELGRPADYDPQKNAAIDCQLLFSRIPPMPEGVKGLHELWPGDMNDLELQAMRRWAAPSAEMVSQLLVASQKPQYWVERYAPDGLTNMDIPELRDLWQLRDYFLVHAKLEAYQGRMEPALNEISGTYALGTLFAGPKSAREQMVGFAISGIALKAGFQVVAHCSIEAGLLSDFQKRLTELAARWNNSPNFRAERLRVLDWIQRTFSDDGDGNGCISRRRALGLGCGWNRIDRAETVSLLDDLLTSFAVAAQATPWQCREEGKHTWEQWVQRCRPNFALVEPLSASSDAIDICWRLRTETTALLTTLAIQRYQRERGSLPESLDELVAAGYLDASPMDPFASGPLTYRLRESDFILYSFGLDFKDDGGRPGNWGKDDTGGDQVFWPVSLP